ncbi:hypothetical protein F5Y06DRAFT_294311 [Hypoxylon sp. FL0890]|nr:hypothetical protein F5Y06DRAFT_294311 [Hypoxylon sp. FL0890]
MVKERGSTLRKEAKAIANDRRKRKEKHRLLRQWICDMYKPKSASNLDHTGPDDSDSESSPAPSNSPTEKGQGKVWDLPIVSQRCPGQEGVTLGTMLRIAKDCYKLASQDFDKMDLYDHMYYIQSIREPDTPTSETLVDKALVVMAQHQQHLAKHDYIACVARLAVLSNLPKEIKGNLKTCKNCLDKFLPASSKPCTCDECAQTCRRDACQYHWGELQSHNDAIDASRKKVNLGEDFLIRGKVKLREFKLWMETCYWSCCEGKLVEVGPDAGKRSQKSRHKPLAQWEIPNPYDGKLGCPPLDVKDSAVWPHLPMRATHHIPF